MARDATLRLYDVDDKSVVFKRQTQTGDYDIGSLAFRAKPGKLIDLDKLHESVWATRLSGGTKSGLVSLEVTAVGQVQTSENGLVLQVNGTNAFFVLAANPDKQHASVFDDLRAAIERGDRVVEVTGRLDGWSGRWPEVLRELPPKPRRVLVTGFEKAKDR